MSKGHVEKSQSGQATAMALLSSSNPSCCYCQQSHSSANCKVVTKLDARKHILLRAARCFGCLRKGHINRECSSTGDVPDVMVTIILAFTPREVHLVSLLLAGPLPWMIRLKKRLLLSLD